MNLLIDIGNSFTHFAVFNGIKIIKQKHCPTSSLKELLSTLKYYSDDVKLSGIGISSVVPKVEKILSKTIRNIFNINPLTVNNKSKLPIKLKVKYPSKVGADRICNAVFGYCSTIKKTNVLVIDLGTANTYDLILKNGDFTGGIIAPGIMTSSKALKDQTATLPFIGYNKLNPNTPLIGKFTEDAIRSGLINYMKFATEGIVSGVKKQYSGKLTVILTGGSSFLLKNNVNFKYIYRENTVLEGLNFILNYQKNNSF